MTKMVAVASPFRSVVVQHTLLRSADAADGSLEREPQWLWSTRKQQVGVAEQAHQAAPTIDERGDSRTVEAARALEQQLADDVIERFVRVGVHGRPRL
jgi:hypothetical protein